MTRSRLAIAIAVVLFAGWPAERAGADECADLTRQVAALKAQSGPAAGREDRRLQRAEAARARACAERQTSRAKGGSKTARAEPEKAEPKKDGDFVGGIVSFFFGGGSEPAAPAPKGKSALGRLEKERSGAPAAKSPRTAAAPGGGGSYRTLCVRLCDGFYFPISDRASSDKFAEDEALCAARCPGTPTALYAHRSGAEAETMVSVSGVGAYADLPTAFLYRTRVDAACACGRVTIATAPAEEPILEPPPDPAAPSSAEDPAASSAADLAAAPGGPAAARGTGLAATLPSPGDAGTAGAATTGAASAASPTETAAPAASGTAADDDPGAGEPATAPAGGTAVLRVRKVGPTYLPGQ